MPAVLYSVAVMVLTDSHTLNTKFQLHTNAAQCQGSTERGAAE